MSNQTEVADNMPDASLHTQTKHPALFNLGFRPFFAGASLFAILSIAVWLLYLEQAWQLSLTRISPFQWHAHEMIYGYTLAVIAGFLLTAVKNWTGKQTPHGYPLAVLFSLWLLARFCWILDTLELAAIFDFAFLLILCIAVAQPIIETKQWRQMAILSKLFLIALGNALFYAQALGWSDSGAHLSLYAGLYIVVGLILTIGRRIIPTFIERGLNNSVRLHNSRAIDLSSMLVFLAFFIFALFIPVPVVAKACAALMALITCRRIVGWYTPGVWGNPLLWSFLAALFMIALGFALYALEDLLQLSPYLSVHAFALGAIGVMTLSMMARVSLGHTGRNVKQPPKVITLALAMLVLASLIRTGLPALLPEHYLLWVQLSGIAWLISFSLLAFRFVPIWSAPRVDGKYG